MAFHSQKGILVFLVAGMFPILQTFVDGIAASAYYLNDHFTKTKSSRLKTTYLNVTAESSIACASICGQSVLCENVNYSPSSKMCQLSTIPEISMATDIEAVSGWDIYTRHTNTCQNLNKPGSNISSGLYQTYDRQNGSVIYMFCDYDHPSGFGYTFFSQSAIQRLTTLSNHYVQKDHVIIRHIKPNNEQYETIMKVLPTYHSDYNISVFLNSNPGFTSIASFSSNPGPFLYIGFIPNSFNNGVRTGTAQGYESNDITVSFTNCDDNGNNYIAITPNSISSQCTCCCSNEVAVAFLDNALKIETKRNIPSDFYFPSYAVAFGGCGTHLKSYLTTRTQGLAFGIPFDMMG